MQRTKARGTRSTAPVSLTRSANVASGWPPSRATYAYGDLPNPSDRWLQIRRHRDAPRVAVRRGRRARELGEAGGKEVERRFPVAGNERVDVDEQSDSLGLPIGGTSDGNTSIAVAAEHYLLQILVLEDADQVGHVCFHTDPWTTKVRPLAHPRQRRRPGVMALGAEFPGNRMPLPATTPTAVNEYERRDPRNVPREQWARHAKATLLNTRPGKFAERIEGVGTLRRVTSSRARACA